jgi:hypothetical protein
VDFVIGWGRCVGKSECGRGCVCRWGCSLGYTRGADLGCELGGLFLFGVSFNTCMIKNV